MKTRLILFFTIIANTYINAQNTDSSFNYKDDYILHKIISALPQGWTFSQKPCEFIIARNDSVIAGEKSQFKIQANQKIPEDSLFKYGYKTKSIIVYKYDKRWTYEQTLKASSNNSQIYQQLSKLPEKYKITKLIDKSKSTRGNNIYTGKTDEEKMQIINFEKEKKLLLSNIIQMPNYHTEKYSLFLKSTQGCNDDFTTIYPGEASLQLYNILNLFSELSEKSNQK